MLQWKNDIIQEEITTNTRLLTQRRMFNRVLSGGGIVTKKELEEQHVTDTVCGDANNAYCLVTANGNTYYIPIRRKTNEDGTTTCIMYLRNHPPILMTGKCGKDLTADMNFHNNEQRRLWNRPCRYNEYGRLMFPRSACMVRKREKTCTIM